MAAPKVVSLFSGCGGLDLGFHEAGFNIVFAADHDPASVRAYRHNIGPEVRQLDVRDHGFRAALATLESADVLLGGFPCQGFSKAGPKNANDDRNQLYRAMITALEVLQPKVFIGENVDGLAQNFNGMFLDQIVRDCADMGYQVEWRVVDAAWFGVPQHRRRILIVGRRTDFATTNEFDWPVADHVWVSRNGEKAMHDAYPNWAPMLKPTRTLRQAILNADVAPDHNLEVEVNAKDLAIMRAIGPGQKLCNPRHDTTSVKTWDVPEAFGPTTERERALLETIVRNRRHKRYGSIPNGNPLSLAVLRQLFSSDLRPRELDSLVERKYLKRIDDRWDVAGAMFASGLYKRPILDAPAPTVLTNFANPRFFVHPTDQRPFTVREVARIQSFPDTFSFSAAGVSSADAYRLIGNAVPPLLGRRIADAVLDMLGVSAGEVAA